MRERQSLLLSLCLAACVPAFSSTRIPTAAEPLREGEGGVVVSISANTARVNRFNVLGLRRYTPGSDDGQKFLLSPVVEGMSRDTTLFVGALPEGQYVVSSVGDS